MVHQTNKSNNKKIIDFPSAKSLTADIDSATAKNAVTKDFDYYIRDISLKGYFIRVRKSGKKTYNFETKIPGTDKKFFKKIGDVGLLSEDEARSFAKRLLKDIKLGKSPTDLQHDKHKNSVNLLILLEEYLQDRGSDLKPTTIKGYKYGLNKFMSRLSKKPITVLTQKDFTDWFRKESKQRPIAVQRTFTTAKTLLSYAVAKRYLEENVAEHAKMVIGRYSKKDQIKTHISLSKMPQFLDALFEMNKHNELSHTMRDYFVLMLVTGLRKTEAASLRWENINFKEKTFSIPDNKPGRFLTLPMNKLTHDLFKSRFENKTNDIFVFPNSKNNGFVTDPNKTLNNLSKKANLGFNLRSHDFRRTFTTICNELGINLNDAGVLLNHAKRNVTDNYIVRSLEFQRSLYDKVTARIESSINTKIKIKNRTSKTNGLGNAFRVFFYNAPEHELIPELVENQKDYWDE